MATQTRKLTHGAFYKLCESLRRFLESNSDAKFWPYSNLAEHVGNMLGQSISPSSLVEAAEAIGVKVGQAAKDEAAAALATDADAAVKHLSGRIDRLESRLAAMAEQLERLTEWATDPDQRQRNRINGAAPDVGLFSAGRVSSGNS